MSLIYKHWKTVITVHVRTSKIYELSHSGLKRLAKKSEKKKKKSCICLLWRKNHQQIMTDGQTQTCIAQDTDFLWPRVQPQGRTAVLCTPGSHPEEPLPLLPFPSRLWLSFIIMFTKPDSYRFLRLLSVPLLTYCLHPIVHSLPKANLETLQDREIPHFHHSRLCCHYGFKIKTIPLPTENFKAVI